MRNKVLSLDTEQCLWVMTLLTCGLLLSANIHWLRNSLLVLIIPLACAVFQAPVLNSENNLDRYGMMEIITPPQEKQRSVQLKVRYPSASRFRKVVLYLEKESRSLMLQQGDLIVAGLVAEPVKTEGIRGNFNYGAYLKRKGFTHSTYLNKDQWIPAQITHQSLLQKHGLLQSRLTDILGLYLDNRVQGLVMAMFLGVKSELDRSVRKEFARSGVMHILAVSGLHVSIVWLLVAQLLKPIVSRAGRLKIPGLLIELTAVWSFAWFTGFGPSVQRAAFMFSLFSLAHALGWQRISINITAGSAIILLLLNPNLLFEAGFQLSYAAVFGILLLYPVFYNLLQFQHPVLRYFWSLQCVSLAAVIGTAPLAMYLFHQLPLLFPLSNCLAVPAAFILVGSCPLLFATATIPLIPMLIGKWISVVGLILIKSMQWIASMPYGVWENIYLSRIEVFGLYAMLLLTYRWIIVSTKRLQSTILLLVTIWVISGYHTVAKTVELAQAEHYMVNDHTLLINSGNHQHVILKPGYDTEYATDLSGNRKLHRIRVIDSVLVAPELFLEYQVLAIRSMNEADR